MTNTVTLSSETLSTLKKLYEIHMSLRVVAENKITVDDEEVTVLRTASQNKQMMARVEIPELFPRDFNVYDLREFIAAVNIVQEPEIDFSDDKFVLIKSKDGKQVLRYLESNPELIDSYIGKDIELDQEDIELTITQDQLKSVLTAANTMKLSNIGFIAKDGEIEFTSFDNNNGDKKDTKKYSIEVGESEDTFRMFYNLSNHNIYVLQGEGDLTFTISGKRKISKIDTESGKTFWVAMDIDSTFNS